MRKQSYGNTYTNKYITSELSLSLRWLCFILFRYFEKRLHATEESHKEEIALLQLRLVEGALEESVLKTTDDRYVSWSALKRTFIHYSLKINLFILWFSTLSQGHDEYEDDVKLEKQKVMYGYCCTSLLFLITTCTSSHVTLLSRKCLTL